MKKLSLICAALLLSACGGSDYKAPTPPPMDPPPPVVVTPPPPVAAIDAFFAAVRSAIGSEMDTAEATSLDAFVSTMPDDTEPVAVF